MPVTNYRLVKSRGFILVPVSEEKGVRKKRVGHELGNQLFLIVHEKTVALAERHGQVSAVSIDVREGSGAQGFGSFHRQDCRRSDLAISMTGCQEKLLAEIAVYDIGKINRKNYLSPIGVFPYR